MAEECAECGGWFASPTALVIHVKEAHSVIHGDQSLALNPESHTPGLVCALCGKRFRSREALMRHNFSPHYISNRTRRKTPAFSYD